MTERKERIENEKQKQIEQELMKKVKVESDPSSAEATIQGRAPAQLPAKLHATGLEIEYRP